jgi:hypothetical protein
MFLRPQQAVFFLSMAIRFDGVALRILEIAQLSVF